MSFVTSFIWFLPLNEHVAHEDNSSVARKQCWDHSVGAAPVECSRQPTWTKSGTFVAMDLCWPCTTWIPGASFLQLPPVPGRQNGKACNLFFLVMPRGRGEQKNSPSLLDLTGKFPWLEWPFPWPIAPCSTKAHLHMSHSKRCATPFGDRGIGQGWGMEAQYPHRCCLPGTACVWGALQQPDFPVLVSPPRHPIPQTPQPLETRWKNCSVSQNKLNGQVSLWSLMKFLLIWYWALLHKVWASQGIFAISLTSVSWKSGRLWGATSLSPPHFWKYMQREIFWAC